MARAGARGGDGVNCPNAREFIVGGPPGVLHVPRPAIVAAVSSGGDTTAGHRNRDISQRPRGGQEDEGPASLRRHGTTACFGEVGVRWPSPKARWKSKTAPTAQGNGGRDSGRLRRRQNGRFGATQRSRIPRVTHHRVVITGGRERWRRRALPEDVSPLARRIRGCLVPRGHPRCAPLSLEAASGTPRCRAAAVVTGRGGKRTWAASAATSRLDDGANDVRDVGARRGASGGTVYVGKGGRGTAAGFHHLAAGGGSAPPGTCFMEAAERRRRERALRRGGWRAVPAPFPACPARWPDGRSPPFSACGSRATPATTYDGISVAGGGGLGSTIPPAGVVASAAASAANIDAGAGDGATSDQGGGRVSYGTRGDVFVSAGGVVLCGSGRAGGVPELRAPADAHRGGR